MEKRTKLSFVVASLAPPFTCTYYQVYKDGMSSGGMKKNCEWMCVSKSLINPGVGDEK
jgi:hypothetical protein